MSLPSTRPRLGRLRRGRLRRRGQDTSLGLLAMLILLGVILSIVSPYFLTTTNLLNIGRGIAIVGIVAVGETIVIIAGGFDLSVGSTMAAAGMAAGWLVTQGVPLPLAFAAAILIGIVVGFANGDHHQLRPDQPADRDPGDLGHRARARATSFPADAS